MAPDGHGAEFPCPSWWACVTSCARPGLACCRMTPCCVKPYQARGFYSCLLFQDKCKRPFWSFRKANRCAHRSIVQNWAVVDQAVNMAPKPTQDRELVLVRAWAVSSALLQRSEGWEALVVQTWELNRCLGVAEEQAGKGLKVCVEELPLSGTLHTIWIHSTTLKPNCSVTLNWSSANPPGNLIKVWIQKKVCSKYRHCGYMCTTGPFHIAWDLVPCITDTAMLFLFTVSILSCEIQ